MSEQRYMYMVNPKRPVKGLSDIPILRVRKSLTLTKEDVTKCLQCGTVYRRFTPECIERVTIANLDRFHNEKFMTEDEYKAFLAGELGKDSGKVEIPTVPIVAPPVEDPEPVVDEPKVEEPDEEPTNEVESNGTYWALIKVPSEVVKKFYYDVVIKFTGSASTGGGGNLSKYDVQFFSNDPAFVYNYAHAFNTRGLFIKELSSKMSKEALKKEPVEKNPQENIGYVKSIYFAYLTMQRRQLFRKNVFESEAIKFDPKLLLSQIEPADSKIQRRQDEGAKANTRKKVTVDKDTYGRMRRYMRDGEDYSRLQVQTTKKVGKVTRANPVVKSSVKKTSKVKRK